MANPSDSKKKKRIVIEENGPIRVEGGIPLVRKEQVVSEYGEPLTWKKVEVIETPETYCLCRCGHSRNKPFCDDTHLEIGFNGTETADTSTTAEREDVTVGHGIVVKRDYSICMEAGFCANRFTDINKMVKNSGDTQVRAQMIAMMERCPSGSWSYALTENGPNVEPDLPEQVAVITEITDNGPIPGPIWVTGNIPIVRSDGKPFEIRNRVTLCNCSLSENKPLCDGSHRERAEEIAAWNK